jgi:hypothetical protein
MYKLNYEKTFSESFSIRLLSVAGSLLQACYAQDKYSNIQNFKINRDESIFICTLLVIIAEPVSYFKPVKVSKIKKYCTQNI